MNALLWKVLLGRQSRWQAVIAGAGFCIGLFIMMLSGQLYRDINQVLKTQQAQENEPSFLIINKEVTLLNTFDKKASAFKAEEIDTIRQQPFVVSVGEFHTNQFVISADLTAQLGFSTDLFFEAVPDRFIDNKPEEFKWDPEKKFIPAILPTEFLNLYNFGFAMTQGLPQLPPAAVQMFPFTVIISGKGKKEQFSARVVAFSERIPSVVVPWEFMEWANNEFADGSGRPSRLILEVTDPGDEALKKFLKEKKYLANSEQMKSRKAGAIVKMLITVAGGVGLLFVVLSAVIFLINFQLVLSRAREEINILLNLGYTWSSVSRVLTVQLAAILLVVTGAAATMHMIAVRRIHAFFLQYGFSFQQDISYALLIGAGFAVAVLLANSLALRLSAK
ncbi:MAG: hypothetical protein KatS3mg031_2377 [Chitinophagales bacterium]|nr:MAG: hypothetical protein KatS3mg031_2377 [Chitinophagales bacterium]